MRAPRPIVTFRVRPDRRQRLAFDVSVYQNLRDLRRATAIGVRRDGRRPRTRGLLAVCTGFTGGPVVARISFARTHLRVGTITHEAFHATLRWAMRHFAALPTTPESNGNLVAGHRADHCEERCAIIHGNLVSGIVAGLYQSKLLPQ